MNYKNKKLIVSIVLYKTPLDQLKNCLNSLSTCNLITAIYLIDNSPDNYLSVILTDNPNCIYTHNPGNPGFGAGHNLALKNSIDFGVLYHLVINADIFFSGDIISPMVEYMDNNANIGHLMPKILNIDGSTQYVCKFVPKPFDLLLRRIIGKNFFPSAIHNFEMRNSGYNKIMFVPYLSGCFMLLRVSVLSEIGLFDERFFLYPEDIDLTRRIAMKYDTIFYPHVSVTHAYGAGSHKSVKIFLVHALNIIKYFNKWGWFFDASRDELNKKAKRQFS